MTDLMQQAREFLAAEIGAPVTASSFAGTLPAGVHTDAALRVIVAALRAAPDGFVLVPVVPTAAMERVLVDWLENNESSSGCYAALIAARPQGVKDAP